MRLRSFLLTSAASVGLFMTAVNVPYSQAQTKALLNPVSQWAVKKISGSSAGGQGYCALARRFDRNAVMTIARNHDDATSIALDFQRPRFDVSKKLAITLDPGEGRKRRYAITPASAQAFVVKLGSDQKFFNAIERTGVLRIEVSDDTYVFSINDMQAGENRLRTCLGVRQDTLTPAPRSSRTQVSSNSHDEVDRYSKSIRDLENENTSLRREIEKIDPIEAAIVKDATRGSGGSELEKLRSENMRLRASLQTGSYKSQSDKIEQLRAENKRLASQVSEQPSVNAEVEALQRKVDTLMDENFALKEAQTFEAEAFDLAEHQEDIKMLEMENASLRRSLTEQTTRNDATGNLHIRLSELEAENRALKENSLLTEQSSYQQSQAQIGRVRDEYMAEIKVLRDRLSLLKGGEQARQEKEDEIAMLQTRFESLQIENENLQKRLIDKSEALEIAAYQDDDVIVLRARNQKLRQAAEHALQVHKKQKAILADLTQENTTLKKQVEEGKFAQAKVLDLELKIDNLHEKLDVAALKSEEQAEKIAKTAFENEALRVRVEAAEVESASVESVKTGLKVLKEQLATKDAFIEQMEQRSQAKITSLQKRLGEKTMLLSRLEGNSEEELAKVSSKLRQSEAQLDDVIKQSRLTVDALKAKLSAREKILEDVRGESTSSVAFLKDELQRRDDVIRQIEKEAQRNVASLKDVIAERERTIVSLRRDLENSVGMLEMRLSSTTNQLESIKEERENDFAALKLEMIAKDAVIENLEKTSQTNISLLKREIQQKDQKIAMLQEEALGEIASLQVKLSEKDDQLYKFKTVPQQIKDLLANYRRTKADKEALEQQLALGGNNNERALREKTVENSILEKKLAHATARNKDYEDKLLALQGSVVKMTEIDRQAQSLQSALNEKEQELQSLQVMKNDLVSVRMENLGLKREKKQTVANLESALNNADKRIAELESQTQFLQEQRESVVAENSQLKRFQQEELTESTKLLDQFEAMMEENDFRAQEMADIRAEKEQMAQENAGMRAQITDLIAALQGTPSRRDRRKDEERPILVDPTAKEEEGDTLSGRILAKNTPVAKDKSSEPSVVLASVKNPDLSKVKDNKISLHTVSAAAKEPSLAEQLAAIIPAAGDEDSEGVTSDIFIAQSDEADAMNDAHDFMNRNLNQAQIYEEQLKRSMDNQGRVLESIEEAVEEDVDASIEVSEDFASETDLSEVEDEARSEITDIDIESASEDLEATAEASVREDNESIIKRAEDYVRNLEREIADIEGQTAPAVQADADPVVEDDSDFEVKMSKDPFEGVEIVDDAPATPEKRVVEEAKPVLRSHEVEPPADIQGVDPEFETDEFSEKDVVEMAEPVVEPEITPKPEPEAIEKAPQPAVTKKAPVQVSGSNPFSRLLRASDITNVSRVKPVTEVPGAFQWRVGNLFGSGERRPMQSLSQFDDFVKDYLSNTESRCPGDFAIVPDNSQESGSMRIDSYEIACVGYDVKSAAALVFYGDGKTFTVVAHETGADDMDKAMATRDKIFKALVEGRDS